MCTCVFIVYETIRFVILTTEFPNETLEIHLTIIPLYFYLIGIVFQVISVLWAFKLSYLILHNRKSINHQEDI